MRGEPVYSQQKPEPKLLGKRKVKAETNTAWRKVRAVVLARDQHRCRACQQSHGLDVHHVIMRSLGGSDDEGNLIALCNGPTGCHQALHGHVLHFRVMNPAEPQKGLRFQWSK